MFLLTSFSTWRILGVVHFPFLLFFWLFGLVRVQICSVLDFFKLVLLLRITVRRLARRRLCDFYLFLLRLFLLVLLVWGDRHWDYFSFIFFYLFFSYCCLRKHLRREIHCRIKKWRHRPSKIRSISNIFLVRLFYAFRILSKWRRN